jgi:hypothetical protein
LLELEHLETIEVNSIDCFLFPFLIKHGLNIGVSNEYLTRANQEKIPKPSAMVLTWFVNLASLFVSALTSPAAFWTGLSKRAFGSAGLLLYCMVEITSL